MGRIFANLPELETERLLLRKMRLDDAEAMFAYASDPEVTRYVLWDTHRSVEDSEEFLRHATEGYERGDYGGWGVESISQTIGKLTDFTEEEAKKRGIEAVPAKRRVRHMIGLRLGAQVPEDLAARLAEENVFVSVRGESVRVSPHLYNTQKDIERLFEVLRRVIDQKAR